MPETPDTKEEKKEPEENMEILHLEARMGRFFLLIEKLEAQKQQATRAINETIDKIQKLKSDPPKPE